MVLEVFFQLLTSSKLSVNNPVNNPSEDAAYIFSSSTAQALIFLFRIYALLISFSLNSKQ